MGRDITLDRGTSNVKICIFCWKFILSGTLVVLDISLHFVEGQNYRRVKSTRFINRYGDLPYES